MKPGYREQMSKSGSLHPDIVSVAQHLPASEKESREKSRVLFFDRLPEITLYTAQDTGAQSVKRVKQPVPFIPDKFRTIDDQLPAHSDLGESQVRGGCGAQNRLFSAVIGKLSVAVKKNVGGSGNTAFGRNLCVFDQKPAFSACPPDGLGNRAGDHGGLSVKNPRGKKLGAFFPREQHPQHKRQ